MVPVSDVEVIEPYHVQIIEINSCNTARIYEGDEKKAHWKKS